jgi:hypothetical protein
VRSTLRVFVGTCAIATAIAAAAWWREPLPEVDEAALPVLAQRPPHDTRIPPYQVGITACGSSDTYDFSDTVFETPVGTRLTRRLVTCESEKDARREFDSTVRDADRIMDTAGRCGETTRRALIATSGRYVVVWREGRAVISLFGPTPGDVLAFERHVYPCAATLKEKGDSPL